MLTIALRPGLLDRVQRMSGLATDRALAGALGVDEEELRAVRADTAAPSPAMLAGLSDAFGLSLGEVATITRTETPAAA